MVKVTLTLAALAIIAISVLAFSPQKQENGKLDSFAGCLKDKGVVLYGAFWCTHCQNQKKSFAKSAHLLPYVECSTPDGRQQLAVCAENNIESYPTWQFPGNHRELGELSLEKISQLSGCPLL